MRTHWRRLLVNVLVVAALHTSSTDVRSESPVAPGLDILLNKSFLPPDFDQETFDQVWQFWGRPLRKQAEQASVDRRREMAYQRYGLLPRSTLLQSAAGTDNRPLQYVVDSDVNWIMNCLSCHQGQVDGRTIPGVPNSQFELATLTDDIRAVKLRHHKPLARMDRGSLFIPLGTTRGTTNAVMFGVALLHYRDRDLNMNWDRPPPTMVHHDLDPPAWWHFKKKQRLYYDGFVPKNHRALMQFLLVPENGPDKFAQWEEDFREIANWISSLEAPPYPYAIDQQLAQAGSALFAANCAACHGTYGERETYPGRLVSINKVGTDRVRLDALTSENRAGYSNSWFGEYGKHQVEDAPDGYIAPPLDGIWATAPYLHNGSVPTLWHLLHADQRPTIWTRVDESFDMNKIGMRIESLDEIPKSAVLLHQRRQYFDTRRRGKSAAGHLFPDRLTDEEKRAVLEYLKTI